jgi:nucleoside-diphosphate-sugar epimerase
MPPLLRAMRAGPLPLLRDGQAATDLTHVDDVVASIWAALAVPKAQGKVFNISGGIALPIRDVVEAIALRCGLSARWQRMPLALVMAIARGMELSAALTGREPRITRYGVGFFAYRQTLDLTQAKAVLGWQPKIGFEEGLARTFAPRIA